MATPCPHAGIPGDRCSETSANVLCDQLHALMPGAVTCAHDGTPESLCTEIALMVLCSAFNYPLPPNFHWRQSPQHPDWLEAFNPSNGICVASKSMLVVCKDCWEKWEHFTGVSMEETLKREATLAALGQLDRAPDLHSFNIPHSRAETALGYIEAVTGSAKRIAESMTD